MRNALLVTALLSAVDGYAQESHSRLGAPAIYSSLGNPLWVKIPIEATDTNEDINASRFSLGYKPSNATIPFVENGEISFERVGSQYFVVIRSRHAIDEPVIGVVVRERLPHGVRSREFVILLDPPSALPTSTILRNLENGATVAQAVQSIPAAPVAPGEPPAMPSLSSPPALPLAPRMTRGEIVEPAQTPASRPKRTTASASVRPRGDLTSRRARPPTIAPAGEIASEITTPAKSVAVPSTKSNRADRRGPNLSLSLSSEMLSSRPTATETERAVLRQRQLMLDMDDLTAALMDRTHRISLLEKELGNLTDRLSAAERLMKIRAGEALAPAPATTTTFEPILPAADKAAAADPIPATAPDAAPDTAAVPAARVKATPIASIKPANAAEQQWPLWKILLATITSLLLVSLVRLSGRRHHESRGKSSRLAPQLVDDDIEEPLDQSSVHRQAVTKAAAQFKMAAGAATVPVKAQTSIAPVSLPKSPDIHFELPGASSIPRKSETHSGDADFDVSAPLAGAGAAVPSDDLRSRRLRYLESRYNDIALLKPPLDAPQKLLCQAATLYDEGAVEFAKRLLKYAAYSRPHTEEFWLAVLELLFREKFANDYVVNAKWFHRYHAQSKHWDEVQRIGYLLDSSETLFASAAAWSHEEPAVGVWLPSGTAKDKSAAALVSLSHLKLELAS